MKKNIFTVALLAMAVATSCSKELDSVTSVTEGDSPKGELVTVTVEVNCGSTRSVAASDEEKKINSVQTVVFDANGKYEGSTYSSVSETPVLEVSTGTKTFTVIVNSAYIEPSEIKTLTNLREHVTELKSNSEGNFIMYGEKVEGINKSGTVNVDVKRIVARLAISKITNGIDPEALPDELILKRIYIINVAGDAMLAPSGTYSPTVWYNKAEEQSDLKNLLCSEDINYTMRSGDVYDTPHYFYCYPNPTEVDTAIPSEDPTFTPRYTRLDVEAELNGTIYYYFISIEGIKSNCTYEITNMTITGTGSKNPDLSVIGMQFFAKIKATDWDEGGEYTERIPNFN